MKVAICVMSDQSVCDASLPKMLAAQMLSEFHTSRTLSFPGGKAGCIHTSDQLSEIPLFRESPEGNWLLITGVPIDLRGDLDATLQRIVSGDFHLASQALTALDGAFAAVFWDNANQKILIITDFLGMQPLYIFQREKLLLMATDVKGITGSGLMDIHMDPAGWGSFLSFGHLIGNHTLVKGIQRTEPACIYVIDPATATFKTSTYWNWPEPQPEMTLDDVNTTAIVDILRQEIWAYTAHASPGTVLLSGGFDSRLLLGLLCEAGLSPNTLTIAHPDELFNIDGRLANAVAKRFHIGHKHLTPSKDFFSSAAYRHYLSMSEGMVPSLYLFIAQVSAFITPSMQAVWEGVAPGNALETSHQPAETFHTYCIKKCRAQESSIWQAAFNLFGTHHASNLYNAFREALQHEQSRYTDDGFGVYEFMMRNRMRNRTAFSPLKIYTNFVLPFTPGFSKALWNIAGSLPYHIRTRGQLYFKIFQQHFQKIADIPIVSGQTLYFQHARGRSRWMASIISRLEHSSVFKEIQQRFHKLLTGRWQYWPPSHLISDALSHVSADHPDLDAEEVRKLQQTRNKPPSPVNSEEQHLVFYWQIWRQIQKEHDTEKP